MKLYVGNLSFQTTENDLQDMFEQHGKVSDVALMMDRTTGRSRGFAFVTMNDSTLHEAIIASFLRLQRPPTIREIATQFNCSDAEARQGLRGLAERHGVVPSARAVPTCSRVVVV